MTIKTEDLISIRHDGNVIIVTCYDNGSEFKIRCKSLDFKNGECVVNDIFTYGYIYE